MKRTALTAAVLMGLALGLTAIALADRGSARDPAGDVRHHPAGNDDNYDIVKMIYDHGPNGTLVQTVKVKGKINFSEPPEPGKASPPLLWIDVPGQVSSRPGCQYSDYFVDPFSGEVDECGDGPKTGDATVKKVDSRTAKYSFKDSAIGKPSKYGIAFVEEQPQDNKLVFFDRGPDSGFVKHALK